MTSAGAAPPPCTPSAWGSRWKKTMPRIMPLTALSTNCSGVCARRRVPTHAPTRHAATTKALSTARTVDGAAAIVGMGPSDGSGNDAGAAERRPNQVDWMRLELTTSSMRPRRSTN